MNNILLGTNVFTILIVVWFAFYFNQMIKSMLDLNDEILVAAGLRASVMNWIIQIQMRGGLIENSRPQPTTIPHQFTLFRR
mgnify:CR=1 FL=1